MSTATPAFYILNKTGVFDIANGFHIRDNLKAHGCFFRPAGALPTIPVKSWVGVAADDDAARTLAKKLRNDVKRLDARTFCHKISVLAVTDDDLKNLKTAGLVHTPKQTKNSIVEVLSDSVSDNSDSADGDYDEDEPIEYVGNREEESDDDGRVEDTYGDKTEGEQGNGSDSSYKNSDRSSDSSSDDSSSDDDVDSGESNPECPVPVVSSQDSLLGHAATPHPAKKTRLH
ncbi:unnamed protein product [Ectocarpus sp. 12 AP-2014]